MNKIDLAKKVQETAEKIVVDNSFELVHVKVSGSAEKPLVQIFIDKPKGISHEDCSIISRELGTIFDAEDFISSAYILEVSSPGLERELYSLQDFRKFIGSLAKVRTNQAVNGQRNFSGRIKSIEKDEIVFDDKTKGIVKFTYSFVAKANLEIDIDEEFRRAKTE